MTEKADGWAIFGAGAAWLLLFPDGGEWLSAAPLERELASWQGSCLAALPLDAPLARAVLALGLAAVVTFFAQLARRASGQRAAAFAGAAVLLASPVLLLARLDGASWLPVLALACCLPFLSLVADGARRPAALSAPAALLALSGWSLGSWGHAAPQQAWRLVLLPATLERPADADPMHLAVALVPLLLVTVLGGRALWREGSSLPLLGVLLAPALVLAWLAAPGWPAALAPLACAFSLAVTLLAGAAPRGSWRLVAAAALALFALSGAAAVLRVTAAEAQHRAEAGAFREAVRHLPPGSAPIVDVVLGPLTDPTPGVGPHAPLLAGTPRLLLEPALVDPGPGAGLRVTHWRPSPGAAAPGHLEPLVLATRSTRPPVTLESPVADALLPCSGPGDEPLFAFGVATNRDPGPSGFSFCLLRASLTGDQPLLVRELDASVLQRRPLGDRVRYTWRPSVRSTEGEERELLWEHGDLAPRDSAFTWTILLHHRDGTVGMALPRRARVGR